MKSLFRCSRVLGYESEFCLKTEVNPAYTFFLNKKTIYLPEPQHNARN